MAKSVINRVVKDLNLLVKRHKYLLLLVLGAVVLLALSKNMFSKSQRVAHEAFTEERKIIYFHMEKCGHCKKFNPEWEKFVQGTDIKSKKISASSGDPLIKKMNVSGYPTVMIIEGDKKIETFSGERTQEGLNNFVSKHKN
jgi:hypothetical protein